MQIIIEQSSREQYTAHSGLALVGQIIDRYTDLCSMVEAATPGNPRFSHRDVVKGYIGLLCLGKSDFEAITGMREDEWFAAALNLSSIASTETLRQRMDAHAATWEPIVRKCGVDMLVRLGVPVTPLSTGHVPLDMDVFPMDNSNTKKEGVSRTYKGHDGFAPIGGWLGMEGWCLGMEFRKGSQHSQEGFIPYMEEVVRAARRLTSKKLLVRLDSAHDALTTLVALRALTVSFIVKWNPRREAPVYWWKRAFAEGVVTEPRPGKRVALFSVREQREHEGKTHVFRRIVRVIERTVDKNGQRLVVPDIELEGWWTSLSLPDEKVIRLYEQHGLCEQFHSEIKSDLDMERLPSGKFATNALVLTLGGFVYNLLRAIGQFGLLGKDAPIRHKAKRRRIRTVMQELMYLAARVVRSGRRIKLRFGKHCPAFPVYNRLYRGLSTG